MAQIAKLVEKVRAAIYGKDVRGSIADAIEAINEESSAAAESAAQAASSAAASIQLAETAAGNANAKAQLADTAAANADAKAQAADDAAGNANAKAQLADTAAANANEKAQAAAAETTDLAQIKADFNAWVEENKADFQTQIGLSIKLTTEDIKDGQAVSYADGTLLLVYKDGTLASAKGGAAS